MAQADLRRTPLYDMHRALGARMVPFAGWEMPVQYAGILEEARAVRTRAGLFDISHMGRVRVSGDGALDLLQRVTSNDVAALAPGAGHYSLLTNPDGGIIDDIIVYRVGESEYLVVINASNTEKDLTWIRSHAGVGVAIDDVTAVTAMIAAQGPAAAGLVSSVAVPNVATTARFTLTDGSIDGTPVRFCRTGYTGEDGFELIAPADAAAAIWQRLQAGGAAPCGLGARDALRIEAGYPLYGHEIDDTTSPVDAGLLWVVRLEKGDFVGRGPIEERRRAGAPRRLVGLTLSERIVPRQGYNLYSGDVAVGTVTSGVFSPTVGHSIAMAYVDSAYSKVGTELTVAIRNNRYPVRVVAKKSLLER